MTTPICTIDATGIHKPTLDECLAYFNDGFKGIYGSDIYLGPDCQDGEWSGLLAKALDDVNGMCVQSYNAYSPATAQGVGLSSVVKVNGIRRQVPSYSTCDVQCIGQAGTTITNGAFTDPDGRAWNLPSPLLIPSSGVVAATATCSVLGAIELFVGDDLTISTQIYGWQQVTVTSNAAPGAPVEQDPELKQRQSISTQMPSSSIFEGILGAIAEIPGVSNVSGIDNDQPTADQNGVAPNSLAMIVNGGVDATIANVIMRKKAPGSGTFGTTAITVVNAYGIPQVIKFSRPTRPPITWNVGIHQLNGYTSDDLVNIAQAISDWTNALGIGAGVSVTRAMLPAYQNGKGSTYEIRWLYAARDGANPINSDVTIAYNEMPFCDPSYVTFRQV